MFGGPWDTCQKSPDGAIVGFADVEHALTAALSGNPHFNLVQLDLALFVADHPAPQFDGIDVIYANCGPLAALSDAELAALSGVTNEAVIAETKDGLGTWRYTVKAGTAAAGPDPSTGGGQFWVVTAGMAHVPGGALLPVNSTVFVGPDDAALAMTAGPMGADLLCMQFPKRAHD